MEVFGQIIDTKSYFQGFTAGLQIPLFGGVNTAKAKAAAISISQSQLELDKNKLALKLKTQELKNYFDNWGSRAYIFSNDLEKLGNKYKGSINIDIDTRILKLYGCKYIFSSNPIKNLDNLNLTYLNSFSNSNSPWIIHLYSIK